MGYFQKWFYSTQTGECEFFIYGGCQGNANNFDSEEECKEACSGNSTFDISNFFNGLRYVHVLPPMWQTFHITAKDKIVLWKTEKVFYS